MIKRLWCFVFGHKYFFPSEYIGPDGDIWIKQIKADYCMRCGAKLGE